MKKIVVLTILIMNVWAIDVTNLLQAHKEALNIFQKKDGNFYKSIELLRGAGVQEILNDKPKDMNKADYVHILNDYGYFLSLTEISSKWYGPNYCEAKTALEKVMDLSPNRTAVYLNLGDLYWKIYKGNLIAGSHVSKMARHSYHDAGCIRVKYGEPSYPYLGKQMYLKYEKQMIASDREKNIPERIHFMLKNDKVFVLINVAEKKDEGLCKNYISTLNRFSKEDRTYCNRDFSKIYSEFKLLSWDSLTKKHQDKFSGAGRYGGTPLEYNQNMFFDYIGSGLYRRESGEWKITKEKYDYFDKVCKYHFFNLSLKINTRIDRSSCKNIGDR